MVIVDIFGEAVTVTSCPLRGHGNKPMSVVSLLSGADSSAGQASSFVNSSSRVSLLQKCELIRRTNLTRVLTELKILSQSLSCTPV